MGTAPSERFAQLLTSRPIAQQHSEDTHSKVRAKFKVFSHGLG
jgi:hypothetical protein